MTRVSSDDAPGRLLYIGGFAALAALIALFVWASIMQIASAAVAAGQVTVEGNRKAVQHRDGGAIEAVFVREGERVAKGQPLVKLNLTDVQADEAILKTQLLQLLARVARLRAETSGGELTFPELLSGADGRAVAQQEEELFRARREAHLGQIGILDARIAGAKQQITGLNSTLTSIDLQLQTVREEADSIADLVKEGLITKTRKLALDRAAAEYAGNRQTVLSQIDEQRHAIEEASLQGTLVRQDREESIAKDLSEAEAQLAAVQPQLSAVRAKLERGVLAAPEEGFVLGLSAFGPGAVITPGQTVLEIVPANEALVLSVEISPRDIDQVQIGQTVAVHLLAYRQRYQIKLTGILQKISADEIEDKVRQIRFYKGVVAVDEEELMRSGAELMPGMPVQVMIETGSRSVMAYFIDPLLRTYEYALRDE